MFLATSENKKGKKASAPVTRAKLNRSLTRGVLDGEELVGLPGGRQSEQDALSEPGKWAKEAIVKAAEKKEALQTVLLDMYQNGYVRAAALGRQYFKIFSKPLMRLRTVRSNHNLLPVTTYHQGAEWVPR